jgi:hypothetical protein
VDLFYTSPGEEKGEKEERGKRKEEKREKRKEVMKLSPIIATTKGRWRGRED